jgi:hypothetical protein
MASGGGVRDLLDLQPCRREPGGRRYQHAGRQLRREVSFRYQDYCRLLLPFQAGLRIRIHLIRIRIQHFRLNTNPDPIRIRIRSGPGF